MNKHFINIIKNSSGANEAFKIAEIQSLWSGYGHIYRYGLKGSSRQSVIVKHIRMPNRKKHPRGWNTDLSHNRKVRSYAVEMAWYEKYSHLTTDKCRIPGFLAQDKYEDEILIVMEDLDDSGYPLRKNKINKNDINNCLQWLANFHALFMNKKPEYLWKTGTYWHLKTRPEELKVLVDNDLKNAAPLIDRILNSAKYKTFVHGDAKLANFCFAKSGSEVAAVDFQYVGGGIGMKDVAYFLGSCLYEDECERMETSLLDTYFTFLHKALKEKLAKEVDFKELEEEWRMLYPVAWTDFHRFIKGWSPGHWKINSYSERLSKRVIQNIKDNIYDFNSTKSM